MALKKSVNDETPSANLFTAGAYLLENGALVYILHLGGNSALPSYAPEEIGRMRSEMMRYSTMSSHSPSSPPPIPPATDTQQTND